ncbi:unnamed protein product [Linum tenue]|uniref:Flavin-containing monooxygenase n=1 Tax=Linum tenue TaxID=586396 RepID=A0AAV0S8M7_9ROSI|nr:unnamed protein product [Linum tenue]
MHKCKVRGASNNMERRRRVGIVGAGPSGLLACKYVLEKGFDPIVFESENDVGGIWSSRTIASTKLQNSKGTYRFTDFPWPQSVHDVNPSHTEVLKYMKAYAEHFGILQHIKFHSKVIGIDCVGESLEEMKSWVIWGGNGKPFGSSLPLSKGKWQVRVQDVRSLSIEVYEVEFVILCIGLYSGYPNIPDFPPNQGPEVFKGRVVHSWDYSAMGSEKAAEFVRGKRVAIVGSQKTAIDIAAECAKANGPEFPCTMVQRTTHWTIPSETLLGINIGFLYLNRFSEFLIHKPGESLLLSLLATFLMPLRWGISKMIEFYLRWKLPLKKHGMVPELSFFQDVSSCHTCMLPDKFYDRVEEGSIVIKKSKTISFCETGIVIGDGRLEPVVEADVVILATGYRGDHKLRDIFDSPALQKTITGSSSIVPLYRQVIHPRIPQLAVIGYAESLSSLSATEIRCQWLVEFLAGKFELPSVSKMEEEVRVWEKFLRRHSGGKSRRACISNFHIWNNDQFCKDMGLQSRRKKGFLRDLFMPYGPADYTGLLAD